MAEDKVCWTEISNQAIRCSQIDPNKKGKVEVIVDTGLMRPEGLAADWANHMLYWTDSQTKRIEVVSLKDTSLRRVLIWSDLDLPRAIAVSPADG